MSTPAWKGQPSKPRGRRWFWTRVRLKYARPYRNWRDYLNDGDA